MAGEIKATEINSQEPKPQEKQKEEGFFRENKLIIELILSLSAVLVGVLAVLLAFPNSANFEIAVNPNNISIDTGDINTVTINVGNTGFGFLSDWWPFKYDSPVGLNINGKPSNVLITLLPDAERNPPYFEKMVVGVGLDAIAGNYNIMITGIGKTQQPRPCMLTIIRPESNSLDKASLSNKWCQQGQDIMSLGTKRKYTDAQSWFDGAISLYSQNHIAFYYKGLVHEKLKDYKNASDCFNRSILIDNETASVWAARARMQEYYGNHRDALNCIDKSLEFDLENAQLWENKSKILFILGENEYAQQCNNLSNSMKQLKNTNKDNLKVTQKPVRSLREWISYIIYSTKDYSRNSYNRIIDFLR